jgi:hypothetical protein
LSVTSVYVKSKGFCKIEAERTFGKKNYWINSKKLDSVKIDLHTRALKKMDLSHLWQQHIFVIKGRYLKNCRPILYAVIVALRSLPSVAPSTALRASSILYYSSRIIYKHAVALKALNPRDLKKLRNFIAQ